MENVETLIYLLLGLPLLAAANTLLLARFKNLRDGQAVLLGLVTRHARMRFTPHRRRHSKP